MEIMNLLEKPKYQGENKQFLSQTQSLDNKWSKENDTKKERKHTSQ